MDFIQRKSDVQKTRLWLGQLDFKSSGSDLKNFSDIHLFELEYRIKGNVYGYDTKPAS